MALHRLGGYAGIVWILLFVVALDFVPVHQLYQCEEEKSCFAKAWSPLAEIPSKVSNQQMRLIKTGLSQPPFSVRRRRRQGLWATTVSSSIDEIPCLEGLSYLPFQQEVILDSIIPSSCDGRRGILLADEMGLGKTVSIIGSINVLLRDHYNRDLQQRRFKVLIVAPKSVLSHWEHELNRWVVLPPNAIVTDAKDESSVTKKAKKKEKDSNDGRDETKPQIGTITAKDGVPKEDCDVYLINYEIVGKYLEELFDLFGKDDNTKGLDVFVCDECHYLKSVDSQRTHATLGHHKHSTSQPGVATMAERLWLVTGSPILNNPLELFPLLNALAKTNTKDEDGDEENPNITLEAFPEVASLDSFRDRYCGRQETPWGVTYKGGKHLSELRTRLIQPLRSSNGAVATTPLMVRRTKQQVLPELPDKRHQLFPLDDGGIAASEEFELLEAILKDRDNKSDEKETGMETYLRGLKVVDLKKLAKERDLPVGGRKVELIERLLGANVRVVRKSNDDEDLIDLSGDESGTTEESILFPSRPIEERTNDAAIDLQSSALSVLQSAPSENRKQIMRDLLRVPKLLSGQQGSGNTLLGGLMRARHQTALRKVPYVIELLEIALLSHKVVVFAHHRDVQDIIYQHFSDKAVALNGDTPQEDRMKNVQAFQNDPDIKLFVGSIRASGLGISLTAASHVVFVEMDWSPSIIQQAEDRCHRVGQKASVLVQYIFFKGTIDEHLSQLLVEKQRTLSAAIEEPPEGCSWEFDFGKHSGKVISDVAAEDPGYLKWLVDEKIYVDRRQAKREDADGDNDDDNDASDDLTEALIQLGFLKPQEKDLRPQEEKAAEDISNIDVSSLALEEARNHIIAFGKHKGKPLKEIPRSYLVWVSLAGASKGKPGLTEALQVYLADSSSSVMCGVRHEEMG